jgi:hypothetical protein
VLCSRPGSKLRRRTASEWPTVPDTRGCEQRSRQDRPRLQIPKATRWDSSKQRGWSVTWMLGGDSETSAMVRGADAEGQGQSVETLSVRRRECVQVQVDVYCAEMQANGRRHWRGGSSTMVPECSEGTEWDGMDRGQRGRVDGGSQRGGVKEDDIHVAQHGREHQQ